MEMQTWGKIDNVEKANGEGGKGMWEAKWGVEKENDRVVSCPHQIQAEFKLRLMRIKRVLDGFRWRSPL